MSGEAAPAADGELNVIIALLLSLEYDVGLVYKGFTVWQVLRLAGDRSEAGWKQVGL